MRPALAATVWALFIVAPSAAQEQDAELEASRARCDDVLKHITRGRGTYAPTSVIYEWSTFHQLFDSGDPRVRRLAADALARLVSWGWYVGPGTEYLGKTNDPYVRSAVLASMLPAAAKNVSAGAPDYVIRSLREHRDAVAPVFREILTAPTAPPYLDMILRFAYQHSVPSQMIPDAEDERALVAKRVVHAAAVMFEKARTQTAEDYPETTFRNKMSGEPWLAAVRNRKLESFRKRDRETAARVLFAFAEAIPKEFWSELRDYLQATPDVEFRRFVVADFLSALPSGRLEENRQGAQEEVQTVLEVLSEDWDEEVRLGARRLLRRWEATLEPESPMGNVVVGRTPLSVGRTDAYGVCRSTYHRRSSGECRGSSAGGIRRRATCRRGRPGT